MKNSSIIDSCVESKAKTADIDGKYASPVKNGDTLGWSIIYQIWVDRYRTFYLLISLNLVLYPLLFYLQRNITVINKNLCVFITYLADIVIYDSSFSEMVAEKSLIHDNQSWIVSPNTNGNKHYKRGCNLHLISAWDTSEMYEILLLDGTVAPLAKNGADKISVKNGCRRNHSLSPFALFKINWRLYKITD